LVLGRKEVGKTAFINHMTGHDNRARVAVKGNDGTDSVHCWNGSDGKGYIDAPGFGSEGENAPIILVNKIRQYLMETKITICGVIIVDDISSHIGLESDFIISIVKEFFLFDDTYENYMQEVQASDKEIWEEKG